MAYCETCESDTARDRKQVANFVEDADGGTDVRDWGMLIYDKCLNCETVHVNRRNVLEQFS